ncbi:MAG: hypothetical protein NXI04_15665 [Planctomycetaceae bacterium]|nr:hypothetical protein [Planctomycetaceae bacterium]
MTEAVQRQVEACLDKDPFLPDLVDSLSAKAGNQLIHFARFAILPPQPDQSGRLLCSLIVDDERAISQMPDALRRPLEICHAALAPQQSLFEWLNAHRIENRSLFVAAVGETVRSIRSGDARFDCLQDAIDRPRGHAAYGQIPQLINEVREATSAVRFPSGLSKRQQVRRRADFIGLLLMIYLPVTPALLWLLNAHPSIPGRLASFAAVGIGWPIVLFLLIRNVWGLIVHWFNRDTVRTSFDAADLNYRTPTHWRQNAVTLVLPVRDNPLCRLSLRLYLRLTQVLLTYWFSDGRLNQVNSIHFARFFLIDRGRRLVFLSDYDGAIDHYLAEFVSVGRLAIIPILLHTAGCPPTRWFFRPGDSFAQQLPGYIAGNSVLTHAVSAYPSLSVRNVLARGRLNTAIDIDDVPAVSSFLATCR